MPKTWWLRDLIYLALFIAVLIGAWWAMEYAVVYWPVMRYYNRILVLMGINITLAVSLNIINGHAGQFSLGHAGFMAIGAYTAAYLTVFYFGPYVQRFAEGSTQSVIAQNGLLLVAILVSAAVTAFAGYVVG